MDKKETNNDLLKKQIELLEKILVELEKIYTCVRIS